MTEFRPFPSIPRFSKETVFITEKIDGTNSQILITLDGEVLAGSRNRWLTVDADNFGFARWAEGNKAELLKFGPGRFYGEWWGAGIQRGYGLKEKRFSLFNVSHPRERLPECVSLVPSLYFGPLSETQLKERVESLRSTGSVAAPGFMKPEGVVMYCVENKVGYKKLLEKDDIHKYQHATPTASEKP